MVSADPLGGLSLLLGRLDSSRFWHGFDASLADRWSIESRPFLFLLLGGRLRLVGLILLHLQSRARLGVHCEAGHSHNCFSSIDQKEWISPSRPIRSGPQSPKN